MNLKKWLSALLVITAAVVAWGVLRKTALPKVNFTRVKRTTLTSTLTTNGKVEPFEWQAIHAERAGILSRVAVRNGDAVKKNQVIASISDPSLQADLLGGEARVAEARANLSALEVGGKPAELAQIESSLKQAQLQLQQEQKDLDALQRLAQKQAATTVEVDAVGQKVKQAETEIQGLEERRAALVGKAEAAARARLREAQTAYDLARDRAAQSVVRAPMAGVIYALAVRTGGYVNPVDLLANIGKMDRLRVRISVDEPELGRVAEGEPVTITWQALPGRHWDGSVEQKPCAYRKLRSV
jgi:HlyD family secretion protein